MKTWRLLLLIFQVTNIIHRCLSLTYFTLTLQIISSLRKKGSWLWWAGLLLENLCCGAIRLPLHSRETHQFFHFSSEDLKVWEFSGEEHFWVFIVKIIKRDLAVKRFCAFICPAVQIESIPLLLRFAGRAVNTIWRFIFLLLLCRQKPPKRPKPVLNLANTNRKVSLFSRNSPMVHGLVQVVCLPDF